MKRYIEIVYDNSGSMTDRIGNKTKYEIAQDLFEKEILPTIGLKGDHIILRLLGDECNTTASEKHVLTMNGVNNRKDMLSKIKSLDHDKGTPLFYTIADSIEACKNERADEYLIFVITDGDDTCGTKIEEIISQDLLDKYVKFYKILLVQLAIDSDLSKNNLTAFTSYLGGQTVVLDRGESVSAMRSKMKKALSVSGFSVKLPLEHCFDSQPGFNLSWEELATSGIDFHQALLLYNKNILSWQPEFILSVSTLQLAELKFLFGLYFKTGLEDSMIKTMLAQLKRPYYYSHDCIYWDFLAARWKYFIRQNIVKQMDNPDALHEDFPEETISEITDNKPLDLYDEQQVYKVAFGPTIAPTFQLIPMGDFDWSISLKPGDLVKFERN